MRKFIPVLFMLLCSASAFSQKIYGTVFNDKGDLLPFSSITIKGSTAGASSNDKAKFSFSVSPGTYTLVCQRVGYTAVEKKVTIKNQDEEVIFVLPEQKLTLPDVTVKTGGEDPAYEIIRNAIKKRNYYNNQVDAFTCGIYSKDIIKLRTLPKRVFGQRVPDEDRKGAGLDSAGKGILYLSESVSKVSAKEPNKFKMEVISSRVSGSGSFGFTFPAFISLYNNNVTVFSTAFNPRGFVSPIADGAIGFYKYKFLGNFWEDGRMINSIRVTPRRKYEPLFSGIINITDGDWRIHSFDLLLTKTSQLEIMDSLQLTQQHVPVSKDVWRVKNQLIHFNFKQFGIDAIGNFLAVYSDYNIEPTFDKNFFDRVVIKYDTAVNKRPKEYWDSIRPVPLEREEEKDYAVKDSIYQVTKDSMLSQRSVDSLNKKQGKIKPLDILWKGVNRRHYSTTNSYSYGVEALIKNMEYNFAEGAVINVRPYFQKSIPKWKSSLSIEPTFRYGFSNTHFNPSARITLRTRDWEADQKMRQFSWVVAGGKRVNNFFKESSSSLFSSSISALLWGNNFMKFYENYYANIGFSRRYESGFRFSVTALYEDRIPLNNTTTFTISRKDSSHIEPNYPIERLSEQFERHQAVIVGFDVSFKPGQRYIQFPRYKMPLGSKYPTFTFSYRKGINGIFGSDVDYDHLKFTVNDDKNFKLLGLLKYRVGAGGFVNAKKMFFQDYQHFNAGFSRSDFGRSAEFVNSFQLARYYQNSTNASFYSFAFLEHHFNGLLTNKIPLFKRLNWNLVAGTNALYVNQGNNYIEAFAGLENILKIFRLDYIVSWQKGLEPQMGLRLGGGGLIGGAINANGSARREGRNTLDISF